MPDFRTVTGRWLAKTQDGRDDDIHPDGVPLWGHVSIEPVYKPGMLAYPNADSPRFVEPQTISAQLNDGDLVVEMLVEDPDDPEDDTYVTQPVSLLVSEDPAATQTWSYRLVFDRVTIGEDGEDISLPVHRFSVPPGDEPLDLASTIGTTKAGVITVQGPPGAGLAFQGELDSTGDLPDDATTGDGWLIDGNVHIWSGTGWANAGPIQGPTGTTAYEYAVEAGYGGTEEEYADAQIPVPLEWSSIEDRPAEFPSEPHTHRVREVNGLEDRLGDLEGGKADKSHGHEVSDVDGLDGRLAELEAPPSWESFSLNSDYQSRSSAPVMIQRHGNRREIRGPLERVDGERFNWDFEDGFYVARLPSSDRPSQNKLTVVATSIDTPRARWGVVVVYANGEIYFYPGQDEPVAWITVDNVYWDID